MTFDPSLKRPLNSSTHPYSQATPDNKIQNERSSAEKKISGIAGETFNSKRKYGPEQGNHNPVQSKKIALPQTSPTSSLSIPHERTMEKCNLSIAGATPSLEVMARSLATASKKEIAEFVTNVHEKYQLEPYASKKIIRSFFQHASPKTQAHFFSLINIAENDDFFTHTIFALPRNLTTLNINNHLLNDHHVACIVSQLNNLRSLNLTCHALQKGSDECCISVHAIEAVARHPNMIHLKHLNIRGCNSLNNNAVQEIVKSRYLAGLESLTLEGRNFNHKTAEIVLKAPTMLGLKIFNLNCNRPLAAETKEMITKMLSRVNASEREVHQRMVESNTKLAEDIANHLVKLTKDHRVFLDLPNSLVTLSHEYCELQESINLSILGKFPSPDKLVRNIYKTYQSDPCSSKKIIRQFFQHASLELQKQFFYFVDSLWYDNDTDIISCATFDAFKTHIVFAIPKNITYLNYEIMGHNSSKYALKELKNLKLNSSVLQKPVAAPA